MTKCRYDSICDRVLFLHLLIMYFLVHAHLAATPLEFVSGAIGAPLIGVGTLLCAGLLLTWTIGGIASFLLWIKGY